MARRWLIAVAIVAGCSGLSNIQVSGTHPQGVGVGGAGAGGGGAGGGSDGGSDGGLPDGSLSAEACYLCGASSEFDAGCPVGWTESYQSTATALVCVCADVDGGSGCQFCNPSNPENGGCASGWSCDGYCPAGGYFYLCDPQGQPPGDACFGDAG